jgi:phosphopantetheinyl transferase (holo-ACP synthase)
VKNAETGVPLLEFSDRLRSVAAAFHWHLSLSHEKEVAVALVICEKISRE